MKRVANEKTAVSTGRFSLDSAFSEAVIAWQHEHGRHTLPWQGTRDPYRVWLSEIMLQQTQVAAVVPYYQRFLERFPDVAALAGARQDEVMAYWSGLGYYSRARNLHRCAQQVVGEYDGRFPSDPELLATLPGIGRSTAAAIAAFSYGARAAILDGNVKRVFCRVFGVEGFPGTKAVENALWERAQALLPEQGIEAYTQGLMDLGATVCTRSRPACGRCPLAQHCIALGEGRVHLLPSPKPAKVTPLRSTTMLVVEAQDQVLLEQRPDSGIWGGLLSLPEVVSQGEAQRAAVLAAVAPFGTITGCEPLAPFTHVFTHFKLQIAPFHVTVAAPQAFASETRYVWQPKAGLAQAALPAPVKKLLLGLYAGGDRLI